MKRYASIWLPEFPIERLRRVMRLRRTGDIGPFHHSTRSSLQPRSQDHLAGVLPDTSGSPTIETIEKAPFVLALPMTHGLVVTAANAHARKAGVYVGVSLADARAICPNLSTSMAELEADAKALRAVALWAGRYGPNRNVDGPDGFWIDITGVGHLFGGEHALAWDLIARFTHAGFSARLGIGETYGAAHALARFACSPDRPMVLCQDGTAKTKLGPLPVEALRLAPDSVQLLKRLGLRRIQNLYAIPRPAIQRRFREDSRAGRRRDREALARAVLWRLDQALGLSVEPRTPMQPPAQRRCSQSFAEPLISSQGIENASISLCRNLCRKLEECDEGVLEVCLALYRADGTCAKFTTATTQPTVNVDHLWRLLRERLDQIDAGLGVDRITATATRIGALAYAQSVLIDDEYDAQNRSDAFAKLIDRLSNRLGANSAQTARVVARHLPEDAIIWEQAIANGRNNASQRLSMAAPSNKTQTTTYYGPRTSRPTLLLPTPEPIEVMADLPEGPPARFLWRRVACRVRAAQGPERIQTEWWHHLEPRRPAPNQSSPDQTAKCTSANQAFGVLVTTRSRLRPRDYYTLEDETGARYWVFREGLYQEAAGSGMPRWYVHGVFA